MHARGVAGGILHNPDQHKYAEGGGRRTIVLSWDPVEGASYYKIIWEDFWNCGTNPGYCDILVSEVFESTYTHTRADRGWNSYGISACSGTACSSWGAISGTP